MTTKEGIIYHKEELKKQTEIVQAYEALEVLETIWSEATYTNSGLGSILNRPADQKLFDGLYIDYFARNNSLVRFVQSQAKHFKDMDNSQGWPAWKAKAYKAAKTYQDFYNSEHNRNNEYFY